MSFVNGPHLCLGAGLARMVGRVVTEAFVERFDETEISLAPDYHFESTPLFLEYGPSQLPVSIGTK